MRNPAKIKVSPKLGDPYGIFSFIVECDAVGRELYEGAFVYLQDYIKGRFEDEGLDTSVIPEDIDDFDLWVRSICGTETVGAFIVTYEDSALGEFPEFYYVSHTWYSAYLGRNLDKKTEKIIEEILDKSLTLEDVIKGLEHVYGYGSAKIIYDFTYKNADYFAEDMFKHIVRYLEYNKK